MLVVLGGTGFCLAILYLLSQYNIWRIVRAEHLPRVLMYHSIADNQRNGMNTPPGLFERQLQYLHRHERQSCTVSELVEQPPNRAVALTFDDGFANNYTEAFPLLRRYNCRATIYIAPEMTGIDRLFPAQIQEMQHSGLVEFGAHTMHHVNLTTLSEEEALAEIVQSKQKVEELTGAPCISFAYPYGRFSDEHVEMLKHAGFTSAVTVKKAICTITDPYRINRLSMNGKANMFQFHLAFTRGRYRI